MPPGGSDLRQRRQHETPRRHARVRQDRIGRRTAQRPDVEDVDVDLARAVDEARRAADDSLDPLDLRQEAGRGSRPGDRGDGV
jgi:hypothetical protein